MNPDLIKLLASAEKLTARLRILQGLQKQARERGDSTYELHVEELFEQADLEALAAFEDAKAQALGQRPLPLEASA